MENRYEELGRLVKKHRKEKKYSTNQLADVIGVSHGLVNNIENAKNDVFKLELLNKLTHELNIPIEDVLCIDTISEENIEITDDGTVEILINMVSGEKQEVDILTEKLKKIIKEYINLIIKFKCDKEAIEVISDDILQQLKLIEKIQDINKDS